MAFILLLENAPIFAMASVTCTCFGDLWGGVGNGGRGTC